MLVKLPFYHRKMSLHKKKSLSIKCHGKKVKIAVIFEPSYGPRLTLFFFHFLKNAITRFKFLNIFTMGYKTCWTIPKEISDIFCDSNFFCPLKMGITRFTCPWENDGNFGP